MISKDVFRRWRARPRGHDGATPARTAPRPVAAARLLAVLVLAALLWGLPACGVRLEESGIRAAVLYQLTAPTEPLATDMGDVVAISAAELSVRSVELLPCDSEAPDHRASRHALVRAAGMLVSRARAHTGSTPTRLGVPVTVRLSPEAGPSSPGVFYPPPGDYCAIRLMLGAPDEAPSSHAARIAGRFLVDGEMVDFERTTTLSNTVELMMPRLILANARDAVEIRLRATTEHWLDAMVLSSASPDDRVHMAEQVASSIEARWVALAAP